MNWRFQVKWTDPQSGETRFGVYQARDGWTYTKAYKNIPAGHVIVEDAVLPKYHVVEESLLTDIPHRFDPLDEYSQHVGEEFDKARQLSESLPDGVRVGAMFSICVGDGYAYYVVTKVNRRTCHIEWRGFGADRYADHHFQMGGKFDLTEVARYLEGERLLSRLFGSRGKG